MITALLGFQAEAEVLGDVREVKFAGHTLEISGLDLASAYAVLERLSIGALVSLKLPVEAPKAKPNGSGAKVEAPKVEAPKVEALKAASPKVVEALKAEAPVEASKAEPLPQEVPKVVETPKAEAPKAEAPKAEAPKVEASGVPQELLTATRFHQVLGYFHAQGIRDPADLVAACERVKAQVPLLARVANIPDRVGRCLEKMGA